MKTDSDYEWLLSHIPAESGPNIHGDRVSKVAQTIGLVIEEGRLPYTIGLFGTWGSGKTTCLALLAQRVAKKKGSASPQIIYFNAWKYAGFMEVVPSLIYKILNFGVSPSEDKSTLIARIMLSLGSKYSDQIGRWMSEKIGVDPVEIMRDVHRLNQVVDGRRPPVPKSVVDTYYTQVDKAQDLLLDVLGTTESPGGNKRATVVLIDELDRCDPDEAFNVIRQLRIFFAMRKVPLVFVLSANPEPIGLAIKHRYGLDSPGADYEARRILEKFVDAYVDMSEPVPLGDFVRSLWEPTWRDALDRPWLLEIDQANGDVGFSQDTVKNATAFDAMTSGMSLYSNLRVLRKSHDYVLDHATWNRHLLWTLWHLEIANQLDPAFRRIIRAAAFQLEEIAARAMAGFAHIQYRTETATRRARLRYDSDKGATLFSIFRSCYYETTRTILDDLGKKTDPQAIEMARVLRTLLIDDQKMNFLILLSLLPFDRLPEHKELLAKEHGTLPDLTPQLDAHLRRQFGWILANY